MVLSLLRTTSIVLNSGMRTSETSLLVLKPHPSEQTYLNLPKVFNNVQSRTGPLTMDELEVGVNALSCDNEVLRRPELSDCLLEILNLCYSLKTVPNEWHIYFPSNPCVQERKPIYVHQLSRYCAYVHLCQAVQWPSSRSNSGRS